MKKALSLVTVTAFFTFTLLSCGKDNSQLVKPIDNGSSGQSKCYVSEIRVVSKQQEYVAKFRYNAKNLLESKDDDGMVSVFEYDANNRITRMTIKDFSTETFSYEYDSKGNIAKVKYTTDGLQMGILISEYIYTTSANGLVEKIQAITEQGPIDFIFDYDAKNNIKKVSIAQGSQRILLLENNSFDDKPNVHASTGLSKAYLPHIIAASFFGTNNTNLYNANNILTARTILTFTGGFETSSFTYEYNKEGFPEKVKAAYEAEGEKTEEMESYIYSCK